MEPPKVFVSHASKDKERFVLDFATKLRSQGIDAKVDRWEILPGDSLVDKIFEEGIGQAQAVIVVVSENSVDRPWVREELNAATVRRIEGASKLVPVVLDDLEEARIPTAIRMLAWERIENQASYDAALNRIVMSIYGHREKPPLGEPPFYVRRDTNVIPGLNQLDSLILRLCGDTLVERGAPRRFKFQEIEETLAGAGVHRENALESLTIMDARGYIRAQKTVNGAIYDFALTTYGFGEYAREYCQDYASLLRGVALQIVNSEKRIAEDMATALDESPMMVLHALDVLQARNFVTVQSTWGGTTMVTRVHPELRRWLQATE